MESLDRLRELTESLSPEGPVPKEDVKKFRKLYSKCLQNGCPVALAVLEYGEVAPSIIRHCLRELEEAGHE